MEVGGACARGVTSGVQRDVALCFVYLFQRSLLCGSSRRDIVFFVWIIIYLLGSQPSEDRNYLFPPNSILLNGKFFCESCPQT